MNVWLDLDAVSDGTVTVVAKVVVVVTGCVDVEVDDVVVAIDVEVEVVVARIVKVVVVVAAGFEHPMQNNSIVTNKNVANMTLIFI